jgi:D-glycero-D-manno-heptose 1,7-bisphosphate phosphatase
LLDRDGTIVVERNYLSRPEQLELLPAAAEGLRVLKQMGFGLVVITNQSGVGRGYFSAADLERIHDRFREILAAEGVLLDGIYCCPHTPEAGCECRKPKPGLAHAAARDLGFDPTSAIVIGDKACDINLGRNIGAMTLLVSTGYGGELITSKAVRPDLTADNLLQAAAIIHARTSCDSVQGPGRS